MSQESQLAELTRRANAAARCEQLLTQVGRLELGKVELRYVNGCALPESIDRESRQRIIAAGYDVVVAALRAELAELLSIIPSPEPIAADPLTPSPVDDEDEDDGSNISTFGAVGAVSVCNWPRCRRPTNECGV